jgi:integrase
VTLRPAFRQRPLALAGVLADPRHRRARADRLVEGVLEHRLHVPYAEERLLTWELVPGTRKGYLRNHLRPAFENDALHAITADRIERFLRMKLDPKRFLDEGLELPPVRGAVKRRLAPQTVVHLRTILRLIFDDAMRDNLVTVNPAKLVRAHTVHNRPRPDPLTREDIDAIVTQTPGAYQHLIRVLGHQGLRLGEALELRWSRRPGRRRD